MVTIRIAEPRDAAELLRIYSHYVRHTAVSFEYEVPTEEEFAGRIRKVLERYPYLVAERDGRIIGYAYAGRFQTRAAYQWSAEASIYIEKDQRRSGVGRALYTLLERILKAQNVTNLYAAVAAPADEPDPHLTRDSLAFHQRMGFRAAGEFKRCGRKFDRWYNMVWLEKNLGSHGEEQAPVIPFPQWKNTPGAADILPRAQT